MSILNMEIKIGLGPFMTCAFFFAYRNSRFDMPGNSPSKLYLLLSCHCIWLLLMSILLY